MELVKPGQVGGIDFLKPTQNAEQPADAPAAIDERPTQLQPDSSTTDSQPHLVDQLHTLETWKNLVMDMFCPRSRWLTIAVWYQRTNCPLPNFLTHHHAHLDGRCRRPRLGQRLTHTFSGYRRHDTITHRVKSTIRKPYANMDMTSKEGALRIRL